MSEEVRLFRAFGVADASGDITSPGAVLVERGAPGGGPMLLASGAIEAVMSHPRAARAAITELPNSVLLPGLVNAHTHLDLTHIGPRPFDPAAGFAGWAGMIIAARAHDPSSLRTSVNEGVKRSIAGGVMAVGDIAGILMLDAALALKNSCLFGVSFLEYFGMGRRQEEAIGRVEELLRQWGGDTDRVRLGLQPHAAYTVGLRAFDWSARAAAERGMAACTHLAETLTEREFIASGQGPFRALLESLGVWDQSVLDEIGRNCTPIQHLSPSLRRVPWLLAHVNDCDDEGMNTLAETRASVAYCPRSSSYFRNHETLGEHRYRDMLRAGVNVCLGTDSVVNLPVTEADRLSTLDEMRFLYRRDGTDPVLLMRMATTNGAAALGLDPSLFQLRTRKAERERLAGLIAVDISGSGDDPDRPLLRRVLAVEGPPRVLVTPNGWYEHGR